MVKTCIDYNNLSILETNIESASDFILKIFKTLKDLDSVKLAGDDSYKLISNVQFPRTLDWGVVLPLSIMLRNGEM